MNCQNNQHSPWRSQSSGMWCHSAW